MENFDTEKAARVFQRVRGGADSMPDSLGLPDLISEERADAATYLLLSRKFTGKDSAILRRMYEQEMSHAACLKGIYNLMTGAQPATHPAKPTQEPVEITLRRCYGREMRCLAQYEARSSDPQYGPIFTRLAQQEWEHCHLVLELLGKLKPKR